MVVGQVQDYSGDHTVPKFGKRKKVQGRLPRKIKTSTQRAEGSVRVNQVGTQRHRYKNYIQEEG